jgi:NADPH2:quinone reductase
MVQMAKLSACNVIAAYNGDSKHDMGRSVAADAIVDVRRDGLTRPVLAATDGRGVDAAIDVVATRATLEGSLASLARAGRLVIIGSRPREVFGDETTFSVDPLLVLNRMLEIHGSRYVTLAEIGQTLELLRQRRIRPIVSATFPLEAAEEAHEAIRQNALVGRAALVID